MAQFSKNVTELDVDVFRFRVTPSPVVRERLLVMYVVEALLPLAGFKKIAEFQQCFLLPLGVVDRFDPLSHGGQVDFNQFEDLHRKKVKTTVVPTAVMSSQIQVKQEIRKDPTPNRRASFISFRKQIAHRNTNAQRGTKAPYRMGCAREFIKSGGLGKRGTSHAPSKTFKGRRGRKTREPFVNQPARDPGVKEPLSS
jgi:hypothetical protein